MLGSENTAVSATSLDSLRADAIDGRPGRLKRVVAYAGALGRAGIQPTPANDLWDSASGGGDQSENPEWWDRKRGPSAARASMLLDARCGDAHRRGLTEFARMRLAERVTYRGRALMDDDIERLVTLTAYDADLPPDVIVDLVSELLEFELAGDDRAEAFDIAERERRGYHHCQGTITEEQADARREARRRAPTVFALLPDQIDTAAFIARLMRRDPDLSETDAEDVTYDFLRLQAMVAGREPPTAVVEEARIVGDANEAAFDLDAEPGLLGEIARWSQVYAYRPIKEFAQPAALSVLSVLFGRRWATPTGLGLNLYLAAIAETGGGKDALVSAPGALLAAAGFRHLIGAGDFASDSALEKQLRTRPVQLMPLDEFGKLMQAQMGRNAPPFAKLAIKSLLALYPRSQPGSEWTGKARAGDEIDVAAEPIHSPTLTLLGVSTPEGFFEGMSQQVLEDGFLNRLTVVRSGRVGHRQKDPARLTPPTSLIKALQAAADATSGGGNLADVAARDAGAKPKFRFAQWADHAAEEALEEIEAWEDEAVEAGRQGVARRAAEQCQKIATLRALARSPAAPSVTAEDLRWAFSMVRTSIETIEAGAREMMAGSEFEALVQAVERAVTLAGAAGIAMSHLVRARGVSKADDRMLDAAVKRLEVMERIWRDGPGNKRLRLRRPDERVAW